MFRTRKRIKELERQVALLLKKSNTPDLYVEIEGTGALAGHSEVVPLGQMSARHFASFEAAGINHQIEISKLILDDSRNIDGLFLVLETTEGIFRLPLRGDNIISFDKQHKSFDLHVKWPTIGVGKDMTILDSAIVFGQLQGAKILSRCDYLHGKCLIPGDTLVVTYNFKGWAT